MRQSHPQSGLFLYLVSLTSLFMLVEISFFLQSSGLYFGDFNYIAQHLAIPISIAPGILFYLFAQLLVHLGFTIIVWLLARLIGIAMQCSWQRTQTLGFYLWGIGLFSILLANSHFFPNSKFAGLMRVIFNPSVTNYVLVFLLILIAIASVIAMIGLVIAWTKKFSIKTLGVLTAITMLIVANSCHKKPTIVQDAATKTKPNIIIVGIDSLRPDYMNYLGADLNLPSLNNFFNHATVFGEAITPIARTFPSWVSLLTGKYPKNNGARFDLTEQKHLVLNQALPTILQTHDYKTLFAMDETRFSNMGKNFGFDEIITPPMGLNDFLIGTFNDFPLSNLLVNTKIGQWLFPYSYANRAAFITYQPRSFLKLLQPYLSQNRTQPLFLAIHFCLPHFPYFWADYAPLSSTNAVDYYYASIKAADQQFNALLQLLQQDNLLTHSIVVLISDHGESFELSGDRITSANNFISTTESKIPHFYPPSLEDEKVDEAVGHGTDVLSLSQYHAVLAFRFYGLDDVKPKVVPGVVTLMDIKPTLLSFLNIPSQSEDGISLRKYMTENNSEVVTNKPIFLESDFSPQAIHSVHPETRDMLFEGIDFFQIDPATTKLTVKPSMGALILSSKQYADIFNTWILALYPNDHKTMTPILVNLDSGKWTNDLSSAFAANSPAKLMLQALQDFYGDEIKSVETISA